jgi:hypothetical protein
MAEELVTLMTFEFANQAEMAKWVLEQEGIHAFVADANIMNTGPFVANAIGYAKLQVPAAQVEAAGGVRGTGFFKPPISACTQTGNRGSGQRGLPGVWRPDAGGGGRVLRLRLVVRAARGERTRRRNPARSGRPMTGQEIDSLTVDDLVASARTRRSTIPTAARRSNTGRGRPGSWSAVR